CLQSYSTPPTF
nr:immunoglobulin light chain junction region [Macaca mulatta]